MQVISMVTSTSKNSNCEKDSSFPLLNNVQDLFLCNKPQQANQETSQNGHDENENPNMLETMIFDPLFLESELNFTENLAISQASNLICQKFLLKTGCKKCKKNIQAPTDHQIFTSPSINFMRNCKNLLCSINEQMPNLCSEKLLKEKLLTYVQGIQLDDIGCAKHKDTILIKLKNCCINYAIVSYCQKINNYLSGKITCKPPENDNIKQLAYKFRVKRKRIGKYSDKIKK